MSWFILEMQKSCGGIDENDGTCGVRAQLSKTPTPSGRGRRHQWHWHGARQRGRTRAPCPLALGAVRLGARGVADQANRQSKRPSAQRPRPHAQMTKRGGAVSVRGRIGWLRVHRAARRSPKLSSRSAGESWRTRQRGRRGPGLDRVE